jgi:hypothetical protein
MNTKSEMNTASRKKSRIAAAATTTIDVAGAVVTTFALFDVIFLHGRPPISNEDGDKNPSILLFLNTCFPHA